MSSHGKKNGRGKKPHFTPSDYTVVEDATGKYAVMHVPRCKKKTGECDGQNVHNFYRQIYKGKSVDRITPQCRRCKKRTDDTRYLKATGRVLEQVGSQELIAKIYYHCYEQSNESRSLVSRTANARAWVLQDLSPKPRLQLPCKLWSIPKQVQ